MASDNSKHPNPDDDPIARAMQRAAEKKAEQAKSPATGEGGARAPREAAPSEKSPSGAADIPFSVPRREYSEVRVSPRGSEPADREAREMPTFFSRSREERAEQAKRAAQRVRRRGQRHMPEPAPQEPQIGASAPKTEPESPSAPTPPPSGQIASSALRSKAAPDPRAAKESASDSIFRAWEARAEAKSAQAESSPKPDPQPKPAEAPAPLREVQAEATAPRAPEPVRPEPKAPPAAEVKPLPETQTASPPDLSASEPTVPRQKMPPRTPDASTPMIERALKAEPKAQTPKAEPQKPRAEKLDMIAAAGAALKPTAKEPPAPAAKAKPGAPAQRSAPQPAAPSAEAPARKQQPAPATRSQPLPNAAPQPAPAGSPQLQPTTPQQPSPGVTRQPAVPTTPTKPFAPFEWMISSRYLRARKKEGFVSVIAGFSFVGIMLGVATLIVVMAVMTGFRETLIDQILGVNAHANVVTQNAKFENYDPLAKAIREVDGVTRVSPVVEGQVLATGNRGHSGVVVRGMRKEDLVQLNVVKNPEASNGSIENFEKDKGVAVGANLAAKLGLRVGDYISLISPDGDITPFSATPMPRKKEYEVLYVFKLGLYEYDSVFVYMPLSEAQIYFNKKDAVDSLEVVTENPNEIESYISPIKRAARQSIAVPTWKDMNGSLIGALDIERKVMFIILTMIILVAALNIISGLVMLVKDKTRDVAILRTMGMGRGSILRIFFICGASIGVIGSVAGLILGVLFALNISTVQAVVESVTGSSVWDPEVRMLSEIPSKLQFSDVALTLFIALALSFLATLYPAWKASKLDPVEALRYE